MTNLEWLTEHDTDAVRDALRCFVDGETIGCSECAYDKHRVDGVCMNSSEWLLAEHVDANDEKQPKNDVSTVDVDANDSLMDLDSCTHGMRTFASETDSREKLEADVYDFMELVWGAGGRFAKGLTEYTPEHYAEKCMKLLDRQASITSKEWCWTNDSLQEQVNMLTEQRDRWHDNWTERNVEYNDLADEYDELKAERDEWKAKAEEEKSDAKRYWENANRWGKQNAELKSERDALQRKLEILKEHGVEIVDAVAGGYEVYNEAIRERDKWKAKAEEAERAMNAAAGKWAKADTENRELQTQVDSLKRKLEAAQDVNERQDLEYISLVHEIGTLRAERDRYRELCGKLLDAADEMRRVRDAYDQFGEVDR